MGIYKEKRKKMSFLKRKYIGNRFSAVKGKEKAIQRIYYMNVN